MTTLEDRLRGELARKGQHAKITTAPSVDALAGVAANRHRRNRVGGLAAASVLVAVLFGAALVASQTGQTSAVVAAEGEGQASDAPSVIEETSPPEDDVVEPLEPAPVDEAPADAVQAEAVEAEADDAQGVEAEAGESATRALQADATPAVVETRSSAVAFFGSSGVLITQTGGGFGGIATRFVDSGAEILGLASSNGLDWEEVAIAGIPEGATPVSLETFEGTHVAVFERNVLGERSAWVGTSSDLVNWDLSDPLEGDFVVAEQLLVGPNGVVILGDIEEPDVWSGPIGGPYEAREQLPSDGTGPASVIDGEFVVLGFDAGVFERTVLRSTDGITWTVEPFVDPGPEAQPLDQVAAIDRGQVVLALPGPEGTTGFISRDFGNSYEPIEHGAGIGNLQVVGDFIDDGENIAFFGGEDLFTIVLASGEQVTVAELPQVDSVRRANLVSVDDEQVVVLVETEAGLDWVVVSHP